MSFFKKIFSKPKNKSPQNQSIDEVNQMLEKGYIPQHQLKSQFVKSKEGMDNMSKKQQLRDFKMAKTANEYLQQSIITKNAQILNDLQSNTNINGNIYRNYNYYDQQNNNNQYRDLGFQNQLSQELSQQIEQEDFSPQASEQYQINSYRNKKNEILQEEKYVDFREQSIDFKEKQYSNYQQQQTIRDNIGASRPVRFETNQFISESEISKGDISKQATQHFSKQETIQNAYFEQIFISEEEEEEEEDDDDNDEEENQKVLEYPKYPGMKDNKCTDKMYEMELEITKTEEKLKNFNIQVNDKISQNIQTEGDKKIQNKPSKRLKRRREDLSAVPDEMSSFQITFQRGKKKQLNNGQALSQSIQKIPQSQISIKESKESNLLYKDSKSNLNNLIPLNKSKMSLYKQISNIYSFSEMTTTLSEFQYKKHVRQYFFGINIQVITQSFSQIIQETLIHHQIEDFRFITNIGQGSFGSVDLYEFIPLNFPIAVKTLKKLEEFARELYLMETLQSIYMPQLFYYDETEMKLFMELGLCSLEDLKKYYSSSNQKLTDDQAFGILNQLIVAIELLIDQKAFHSDIKPSNIVIRSKLDENRQINLQLMLIDYGGASFDVEDYWIYYTPAFVCIPLWEKMLSSNSNEHYNIQSNQKYNQELIQELDSIDEYDEQKNTDNQNSFIIQKVESQIINPIYQHSLKKTNLREVDRKQSLNQNQGLLGTNNSSSTAISIPSNNNLGSMNSSTKNNYQNLQSQNQNTYHTINLNSQKFGNESIFRQGQIIQNQSQLKKQLSKEIVSDTKQKKLEQLQILQRKLDTLKQQEWIRTQNLTLDRNNENNPQDSTLSWEEIRFSEIYAGCRCIQYLILSKEDTEELFKKKNIDEFMLRYHKQYPKTLRLMYKVFKKNMEYSMTKSQLNNLFFKTSEKDFLINLDPALIFNISPIRFQLDSIKAKSY